MSARLFPTLIFPMVWILLTILNLSIDYKQFSVLYGFQPILPTMDICIVLLMRIIKTVGYINILILIGCSIYIGIALLYIIYAKIKKTIERYLFRV